MFSALKARWLKWKAEHWDETIFFKDGNMPQLGFNQPPLRVFWLEHQKLIKGAFISVFTAILIAFILKMLGLQ